MASSKSGRNKADGVTGWLLTAPALAPLVLFAFYPFLYAIALSLSVSDRGGPIAIGLDHYRNVLSNAGFWNSVEVTLWYAVGTVPVTIGISLSIALALFRVKRFASILRTAFFVPYVTSTVAAAMVWRAIFEPRGGLATSLFAWLGLPTQTWLLEPRGVLHLISGGTIAADVGPSLALVCVIAFAVWRYCGFIIVVLLAGLANVPREFEDAARIDGASAWRVARHITLPMLSPTLFFLAVIGGIGALQAFSDIFAMTGDGRGPLDTTQSLTVYLFSNFYDARKFEYGAAVAVLLAGGIVGLTALQWRAFSGRVHYE